MERLGRCELLTGGRHNLQYSIRGQYVSVYAPDRLGSPLPAGSTSGGTSSSPRPA